MELPAEALSLELCDELAKLEPFGAGWPNPVFVTRDLQVVDEPRVVKEKHLKFHVRGADGRTHEAIWWGGADKNSATPRSGEGIELAYRLEANNWRDECRLQLVVEDVKKK